MFDSGFRNIKVVFVAGFDTSDPPSDLVHAICLLAAGQQRSKQGQGYTNLNARNTTVGFVSRTAIPKEIKQLLSGYRNGGSIFNQFIDVLNKTPNKLIKELGQIMIKTALKMEKSGKRNATVDPKVRTGRLRSSITGQVLMKLGEPRIVLRAGGSSISANDIFPQTISAGGLGSHGTAGQVLSSTGTGLAWIAAPGTNQSWNDTLAVSPVASANPNLTGTFTIATGGGLVIEGSSTLQAYGVATFFRRSSFK